jgi:hypothetical protein
MAHVHQHKSSAKLLPMEFDLEFALGQLVFSSCVPLCLVRAFVPDHDGAGAIVAFRNDAIKTGVVDGMILGHDGEPFA